MCDIVFQKRHCEKRSDAAIQYFFKLMLIQFLTGRYITDWNLAVNGKKPFPIKGLDQ